MEKWHPTSQRLVLNAVSIDSNSPTEEIPMSYLCIINSDTTGMADRELQHQMSELGLSDAGFSHGLATSLYMGNIRYHVEYLDYQATSPPFTILSWILSCQCRQHVASTSISYQRTQRENLVMRSRPPKSRKSKPQGLVKSYSKLFNFIWASPQFYLILAVRLSSEKNPSPLPSNPRK